MCLGLWLALHLLAGGFPGRITLRAVLLSMGISVACHQAFIERHTIQQDFALSLLAVLGHSAVFDILTWIWTFSAVIVSLIIALAILTVGFYDLVREFLCRPGERRESEVRHRLCQLKCRPELDLTWHENLMADFGSSSSFFGSLKMGNWR